MSVPRLRSCAWSAVLVVLVVSVLMLGTPPVWAGPVDWQEVEATAEGRQWWDTGSLRLHRNGALSVLSRFQPAPPANPDGGDPDASGVTPGRKPNGILYVMELDCGQALYRDTSINGLPQLRPEWQPTAGDNLTAEVLQAACTAGSPLLETARLP
jgi:hypothetical protein